MGQPAEDLALQAINTLELEDYIPDGLPLDADEVHSDNGSLVRAVRRAVQRRFTELCHLTSHLGLDFDAIVDQAKAAFAIEVIETEDPEEAEELELVDTHDFGRDFFERYGAEEEEALGLEG